MKAEFNVDEHPIKRIINKYLGDVFDLLLSKKLQPVKESEVEEHYCLVLETGSLNTVESLLACKKKNCRFFIPNPSQHEVQVMRKRKNIICKSADERERIHVFQLTSSKLLGQIVDHKVPLFKVGKRFSLVYLDYCGNLSTNTKNGRSRFRDVEELFKKSLLNPCGSLLIVTMSSRGVPLLYENQVLDSTILNISTVGNKYMHEIKLVSVLKYDNVKCSADSGTNKIYNMMFLISNDATLCTAFNMATQFIQQHGETAQECNLECITPQEYQKFDSLVSHNNHFMNLYLAMNYTLDSFCSVIKAHFPPQQSFDILIYDNHVLTSTLQLIYHKILVKTSLVSIFFNNDMDLLLAKQFASTCGLLPPFQIQWGSSDYRAYLRSLKPQKYNIIFLDFFSSSVYNVENLDKLITVKLGQERTGFKFLRHVFENDLLDMSREVYLALFINYDITNNGVWESCGIDYIVTALHLMAKDFGFDESKLDIELIKLTDYNIIYSRINVLFRLNFKSPPLASSSSGSSVAITSNSLSLASRNLKLYELCGAVEESFPRVYDIAGFQELNAWDLDRNKAPLPSHRAMRIAGEHIIKLLEQYQAQDSSVILQEHGFHHVLPLLHENRSIPKIYCLTDDNAMVLNELRRKSQGMERIEAVSDCKAVGASRCLLLLSNSGVSHFRRSGMQHIGSFVDQNQMTGSRCFLLGLLIKYQNNAKLLLGFMKELTDLLSDKQVFHSIHYSADIGCSANISRFLLVIVSSSRTPAPSPVQEYSCKELNR